ncbi:MAG TPA: hypothetical protein DCL41_09605 [Bdellovibrionales bacterium]|nr:hypothetical protein [Bdellovibrionales bacterium]
MKVRIFKRGIVAAILISVAGCASYQGGIRGFHNQLRGGHPLKAAEMIEKKALESSDDQVVYLFEYGTALQSAGDFKKSNEAFLKAEELTDIKDYHSLSRITGSLLLNEGMVQYKGEDYEKVLINAMLAINFLAMGKLEDAQVETRKLNSKLYKYRYEAKRNYEQNPFAFYLSGMIWEENKNWDSAYIDFKRAYDLNPNFEYIKEDLIRSADRARRREDLSKWKKAFPKAVASAHMKKNEGEVVLIYAQGWAPEKRPHPNFARIPKLYRVPAQTQSAQLVVQGGAKEQTEQVYSVSDVAIKTLDDAYAPLIAKRVAGLVAKEVVADQIRQKNQALGDLAWLAMQIADRADLRQWSSLPASFQVAHVRLKEGEYKVKAAGLNGLGRETGEESEWKDVKVKKGKRTFIFWRSYL